MLEKYGFQRLNQIEATGQAPTVVVGMSGGVDSSVSAYILKWMGYNVVGLFMKNWDEKDDCECCTAAGDYDDVKRVCEVIGIPYYAVNFAKEYYDKVFAEFLRGLKMGFTPNPDILCNREIKFGPFLDYANKIGAEFIATGHYARVEKNKNEYHLLKGLDENKDQSYFLCGLSQAQLSRVMFPVGGLKKSDVRKIAEELGLITADKKDSTGICFIGERKFRDFLKNYFGDEAGDIVSTAGQKLGKHSGLMYYTLGQRKGLGIGGIKNSEENRWYVVKKDVATNTLVVSCGEGDELFSTELTAIDVNLIGSFSGDNLKAKTRYRQPDQACAVEFLKDGTIRVKFQKPQRAITPGQWVVLYDGERCLGGAQIV